MIFEGHAHFSAQAKIFAKRNNRRGDAPVRDRRNALDIWWKIINIKPETQGHRRIRKDKLNLTRLSRVIAFCCAGRRDRRRARRSPVGQAAIILIDLDIYKLTAAHAFTPDISRLICIIPFGSMLDGCGSFVSHENAVSFGYCSGRQAKKKGVSRAAKINGSK